MTDDERAARLLTALQHEGCGGIYHSTHTRGWSIVGFECSRCRDCVEIDVGPGPKEDHEKQMAEISAAYVPPTACDAHHWYAQGKDVCFCGAMRRISGDCPTCGEEWDRQVPAIPAP